MKNVSGSAFHACDLDSSLRFNIRLAPDLSCRRIDDWLRHKVSQP